MQSNVRPRWPILIIGTIATVIVSLSIHVVMLQVLKIPFPDRTAVRIWLRLVDGALAVFGLMMLYDLSRPRLARFPAWCRALIIAALYGTLKEVFRGIIMNGIVTTAFAFGAAKALIPILQCIVMGGLIVTVTPRLHGYWTKLIGALIIAAAISFAVRPLLESALTPLLQSLAYLDHPEVYQVPYGGYVLLWAYITYLEPVVATMIIAMLVWPALSVRPLVRGLQFVALVIVIKGSVLPTFLYGFYDAAGFTHGMLSESQFLLETLALGLLVAVIWPRVRWPESAGRQHY